MQHVLERPRVGDHGDRPVGRVAVEQPPGVGRVLRRRGQGGLEGEPRFVPQCRARGEEGWAVGAVGVQAARILAGAHAEAGEPHAFEGILRQVEGRAALRGGRVVVQREQGAGEQAISPALGIASGHVRGAGMAEGAHRHDHEGREGDDGLRGHLSAEEAIAAFEESGARRLVIIHRPEELSLPDGVERAADGDVYEL